MFARSRCSNFRRRHLELAPASPPDIIVSEPAWDTDHWVYTVSSLAGGTVFEGATEIGAAPQAVSVAVDAAYSFTVQNEAGSSDPTAGNAPADPLPPAPVESDISTSWREDSGNPGWYFLDVVCNALHGATSLYMETLSPLVTLTFTSESEALSSEPSTEQSGVQYQLLLTNSYGSRLSELFTIAAPP